MNEKEYKQWRMDARESLFKRYNIGEVNKILEWFDHIKSRGEYGLIGEDRVDAFLVFSSNGVDGTWNMYNSLMSRMWIYAPYILKEKTP